MIILKSDCKKCIHHDVCYYVNNAQDMMNRLKAQLFDNTPPNDWNWDVISTQRNVNIIFDCKDYSNIYEDKKGVK